MNWVSPIPRGRQFYRSEGANVSGISIRDDRNVSKQWDKNQNTASSNQAVLDALSKMQTDINRIRRGKTPVLQTFDEFYPFKIYKPDLSSLPPFGVIFDQAGNGTQCTIDSKNPTVLTGATPTINPTTDGWRIQAVRNGIVYYNAMYDLPTTLVNSPFPRFYDVFDFNVQQGNPVYGIGTLHGTDGWGSETAAAAVGNPTVPIFYEYDGQTTTLLNSPNTPVFGCPIIIDDGIPVGSSQQLFYAIWIEIQNQANQNGNQTSFITVKGSSSGYYGNVQSGPNPNIIIPIGQIMSNLGNKQTEQNIQQIAIGHQVAPTTRYTTAALQPYQIQSTLNYVGDWQNDTGGTTPINSRTFFPGDVVSYTDMTGNINMTYNVAGGGGGTVTVTLKFHTEYLLLATAMNTTSNPLGDPNWITIHQGTNTLSFA